MEIDFQIILIVAFILDYIFGDPRKLPHLIVGYGHLISMGERWLNRSKGRFIKGMSLGIVLVLIAFICPYYVLQHLLPSSMRYVNVAISVVLLFYCLANRTLIQEGKAVFNELKENGIEAGRNRLSWIVGRDTSNLTAQQIRIATLETMSENLSDGVIAPLFYFACFGVPGAMAYKMINTLDSMIGYRNERYEYFGKFSAKLDDVANYLPARITAVLMLMVTFKLNGLRTVFREGKKHTSPNAGYPEAALSYIIGCRFGGPNYYHGKLSNKPYIGTEERVIAHHEISQVVSVNLWSSVLFVFCIALLHL